MAAGGAGPRSHCGRDLLAEKLQKQTAEQARRELTQTIPVNPGEPLVKTKLFWASGNGDGTLTNGTVELPLSSDAVLR